MGGTKSGFDPDSIEGSDIFGDLIRGVITPTFEAAKLRRNTGTTTPEPLVEPDISLDDNQSLNASISRGFGRNPVSTTPGEQGLTQK